ncbi:MAG: ssDNA-binding protein [Burkholderia sp.]
MAIVKLKDVRLSFPDLFEAVQYEGKGPFNYRATFLQPKGQAVYAQQDDKSWKPSTMAKVIAQVAKDKWGAKAEAVLKSIANNNQKLCWIDGASKEYDGYDGNFYLSASRGQDKGRPLIVNHDKAPLTAADGKPYAGCYVIGTVEIWAQDNSFGKGIRATLRGVQFLRDGDAFSAGTPVTDDDFEEIDAPETVDDLS